MGPQLKNIACRRTGFVTFTCDTSETPQERKQSAVITFDDVPRGHICDLVVGIFADGVLHDFSG